MIEQRITVWVQRFPDRRNLVLQWVNPDTSQRKSRTAGTDDPDEAEKKRADLEYELNHGKYQEASRMTWERFRELFEEEYLPGLRPKTQQQYHYTFDLFEQHGKPSRLGAISERTVSVFAARLRKKPTRGRDGMHANTIRVALQFLRTALLWAVQQKMLSECPVFPVVKVPKKRPQPIPSESFERMLDKAPDDHMRGFLLCGWLAGLRLGEALALEGEETEEAPWLNLRHNRIVLPAKFAKAVEDQWVPLDPALRQTLEALPREGKKVFRFIGPRGRPIGLNAVCSRVVALARRAGVKLTMHSLRKGFGCRYAGKVSAHVLQRLMRHANIKTTLAFYANFDAAVEEAVLGPQRNSSRNTDQAAVQTGCHGNGASLYHDVESE